MSSVLLSSSSSSCSSCLVTVLSGGADICNCESSVNECGMIECSSMMVEKKLIYMEKSMGP